MATKKHNAGTSPAKAISEERRMLALEAAWEVDSIAEELARDAALEELWKRGLFVRMRQLSSVIMSAMDDDDELPNLRRKLTGFEEASHG